MIEKWHGNLSANLGYALALSQNQAIVWRYSSGSSQSDYSKPFAIQLPFSSSPRQPLPLGLLVHDSGTNEIGLFVVSHSGKYVYWDSVSTAANRDTVRSKVNGHRDTISGMLSGETVVKVVEAEADGFLITFNTGRVAHLSVKDAQGRPTSSIQILRKDPVASSGLFGGLRSVFNTAVWKREIASVKVGPLQGKSKRACIVATTKGTFQVWEIVRHAPEHLHFEVDGNDQISRIVQTTFPYRHETEESAYSILDVLIYPEGSNGENLGRHQRLLVLLSVPVQLGPESASSTTSAQYALLDLSIKPTSVRTNSILPISCYSEPCSPDSHRKPELLVPEASQIAFVVFSKSIVVISLAQNDAESPNSQLQNAVQEVPEPYQDVIHLDKKFASCVVGCSSDSRDRESDTVSCTLLIHSFGLIRVSLPTATNSRFVSKWEPVTAQTKVEQVVFYTKSADHLLDLANFGNFRWSDKEMEEAILAIDESIMKSTTKHIPNLSPSTDENLLVRATALADLNTYVVRSRLRLARTSRWLMLQNAEKMAAARAVWDLHSKNYIHREHPSISLLPELIDYISEEQKVENRPDQGETDIVRHYLIHDVWRFEIVLEWGHQAVEALVDEGVKNPAKQADLMIQANDLVATAEETAFGFRTVNAPFYGFDGSTIKNGLLTESNYAGLQEPWTSTPKTVFRIGKLVEVTWRYSQTDNEDEYAIDDPQLFRLAQDYPRLIQVFCQVNEERIRWLKAYDNPVAKENGKLLEENYQVQRKDFVKKTTNLGLYQDGSALAEKYGDMEALIDVLWEESGVCNARMVSPEASDNEREVCKEKSTQIEEQMRQYFKTFGSLWSNVFFSKEIANGKLSKVLNTDDEVKDALTQFFRKEEKYYSISWMHELLREDDYTKAAADLEAAEAQETDLWSKSMELSMQKLVLFAAEEKQQVKQEKRDDLCKRINAELEILAVQQGMLNFIEPVVAGAIDEVARGDLAVSSFCTQKLSKEQPFLYQAIEKSLGAILAGEILGVEDLVDLLTLIDVSGEKSDREFGQERFFMALKLLKPGEGRTGTEELYRDIVWRRCMIQNDWKKINKTENKNDSALLDDLRGTAVFQTLFACFFNGINPPFRATKIELSREHLLI